MTRDHCVISEIASKYCIVVAQMLKCLPAMRETLHQSLGWEYPLEKEMATHSSILAWKIPWPEEAGGLQSTGWQGVRHDWVTEHAYPSMNTWAAAENDDKNRGRRSFQNILKHSGCPPMQWFPHRLLSDYLKAICLQKDNWITASGNLYNFLSVEMPFESPEVQRPEDNG